MGANLQYEGIKEVIAKLGSKTEKEAEKTPKEVTDEWKRLASFMSRQR